MEGLEGLEDLDDLDSVKGYKVESELCILADREMWLVHGSETCCAVMWCDFVRGGLVIMKMKIKMKVRERKICGWAGSEWEGEGL